MKNATIKNRDYARNHAVYQDFWKARRRRRLAYANQTKVKRFRKFFHRHASELPAAYRVFEQGFGMGAMLECFATRSHLTGLELSSDSVEATGLALKRAGFPNVDLRTSQSSATIPADWLGKADIALSSHVLEHLKEPESGMLQLVEALRQGGYACVVVPINEEHGQDLNHFSYFTAESIASLAYRCGLVVVEAKECDCLWNIGAPIARRLQMSGGAAASLSAKMFNLLFAFWPLWALEAADVILGGLGWRRCQCFLWCVKP
jgi:SAM-dependent methyltransferase